MGNNFLRFRKKIAKKLAMFVRLIRETINFRARNFQYLTSCFFNTIYRNFLSDVCDKKATKKVSHQSITIKTMH